MEPHAAVAAWEGDRLTIFDKSQEVYNDRKQLASNFGVPEENVTVISPFVGGAFGSSLRPNYYPALTAMAARELRRPVKVVYTRTQMFTGHGYRPYTIQRVALGAERSGKLSAIVHEVVHNTSRFEEFSDNTTQFPRRIYACPNLDSPLKIVETDLNTPTWMRAPGAVSGMFALECAMDELAYALKMDPLELRLVNYAEVDPDSGLPFSSKALRECYRLGAERFGWKNRKFEPRSMRDGRLLIGWGTATGIWGAFLSPATVRITLRADGTARVASATSDIGPGTYTAMTIIAAEYLGLEPEGVKFELGDSRLPKAPSEGGSKTTASVGSAVAGAALAIAARILELANRDAGSPLQGSAAADVELSEGRLLLKKDRSRSVSVADVMRRSGLNEVNRDLRVDPPERTCEVLDAGARRAVRRGQGGSGPRNRPRHPGHRGHGLGADHQPPDLAQPGDRRRRLGHRHGLDRGDRDRPSLRPHHEPESPALPRARQRRRPRNRNDVRRGGRPDRQPARRQGDGGARNGGHPRRHRQRRLPCHRQARSGASDHAGEAPLVDSPPKSGARGSAEERPTAT
jgi:xanthine dehydrogenase YagR molybdenum-binding subunit